MINSRDPNELHPVVRDMCIMFVERCKEAGINVIITSTYRDNESQNALYAQGRTQPGKRVTNAKGGQSFHNYRVAFDFVPVINGIAQWGDLDMFQVCGDIAGSVGLEWGGNWESFKDRPHCQFTGGLTLADFRSGKTLEV